MALNYWNNDVFPEVNIKLFYSIFKFFIFSLNIYPKIFKLQTIKYNVLN